MSQGQIKQIIYLSAIKNNSPTISMFEEQSTDNHLQQLINHKYVQKSNNK